MKERGIFYYLIGIFLLFNLCFVSSATINVTNCSMVLDTPDTIYELNISINSSLDCLNISAANITLDCKDYNISFGNSSGGRGIFVDNGTGVGYENITIKNCYLMQNESGINDTAIFLGEYSNNSVIFNNTIETFGNETTGISFEMNSIDVNITSNEIYTNGTDASGIRLGEGGYNATMEENLIVTLGDVSSGILLGDGAYNSTVYNNTIFNFGNRTSDTPIAGIFLEINTLNLNISSNYIIVGGYYDEVADYSIDTEGVSLEEILTGNVEMGGYDSSGIWVWGDNVTIELNLILTFGEIGDGIYLNSVEGINMTSNLIITFGENAQGVRSEMSEDPAPPHTFYGNLIGTLGDNSSCIYLNQSSKNNISLNLLATFGDYSHGIFFNQSHNVTLVENEILANESTSYVLYLITSADELIYNNIFTSSNASSGAYVETSDSSYFNTTKTSGTNIVGESYIGGNYWTNINSNGYSDYCANWDEDYICDSAYVVNAEGTDYFPLTLHKNTTAASSGSGGGGPSTFRPTEEQLKEGYTKQLSSRSKIIFEIENLSHTFKVDSVSKTKAEVTISSETQEATFLIGEEKRFGFSGDGSYDILVKLNSIVSSKANFTMQTIQEEIPVPDEEIIEQTENDSGQAEENTNIPFNEGDDIEDNSPLKWILVGIFFLFIGFAVYKNIKKEKKRYY